MKLTDIQKDLLVKMRDNEAWLSILGVTQIFVKKSNEEVIKEPYQLSTIKSLVDKGLLLTLTTSPNFSQYKLNDKRRTFIDSL